MKKKWSILMCLLTMLLFPVLQVNAETQLCTFTHAAMSGKNLYYAYGNDGGATIMRYNTKTKKKTKFATGGKYRDLTIKGKYLYATLNKYIGTDDTDNYIYRVQLSNGKKTKLAQGKYPVVMGNWIYYIQQTRKKDSYGQKHQITVGLYRMSLTGKQKSCILTMNSVSQLRTLGSKLIYTSGYGGSSSYYYDTKTGQRGTYLSTTEPTNVWKYYVSTGYNNLMVNGYKYYGAGANVYKTDGTKTTRVMTAKAGTSIKKIIALKDKLVVISMSYRDGYVYVVGQNGKGKKQLYKSMLAGGGWGI